MRHLNLYEDFDWDESDFDYEEEEDTNHDISIINATLFELGDRVRQKKDSPFYQQSREQIGTIIGKEFSTSYDNKIWVGVKWDNNYRENNYPSNYLVLVEKVNEDFDWDESEFDYDETPEDDIPKVGDYIRINGLVDTWFHNNNLWDKSSFGNRHIEIVDIKHINDIDYFLSHEDGKRIKIGKYKLPTDYDGYMFLTNGGYFPWFKLENYEKIAR